MNKHFIIFISIIFMVVLTLSHFNVEAKENENLNKTAHLNESSLPTELLLVESKFTVNPTVVLRPVNDVIDTSQDGIIELYVSNPPINNVTLNLEASISVPSAIHIYGSGFSSSGAAGDISGFFSVPPGINRTMYVYIRGEKIGTYTVNVNGRYWPDENKNALILLSLSHPFMIKETLREEKTSLFSHNFDFFQLIKENIWIFVIIGAFCSIILVIFG